MNFNLNIINNLESSWDYFKNTSLPIAIYGTGNGADRVFDEFLKLNIKVSAVVASDGFVRKRQFHGFTVKSISKLHDEIGDFVIALAFASPLPEVINNIKDLSQKFKLLMPSVPVYGNNIFNKDFLNDNIDKINSAYDFLSDDKSKNVFENILKFQITGNLDYVFECETDKDDAYNLLNLNDIENMFDLGAYRGDTVDEFIHYTNGKYNSILAVEPDKRTFKKLLFHCENMNNTICLNGGIWSDNTTLSMDDNMGRGSFIGKGKTEISTFSVDNLANNYFIPTFINCDIEGAESEMLTGAINTLKNAKPKLCISAYHRSEDIFEIINKIKEINPEYKIYLRHHPHISLWDTNFYCI